MKKIHARLRALMSSPQKTLSLILPTLNELESGMKSIQNMPNKVLAIIKLFQIISPIQDAGGFKKTIKILQRKNYGQLNTKLAALKSLEKHFRNAGRKEAGFNCTKPGEEVNASNVILGDVFGIWSHPASFWLENQKRFEVEDSGVAPKPESGRDYIPVWYCINDYQCGGFVKSHTEGILSQIKILKAV